MENEIIYGIRPIVEAIRANVKIEKIWLLKNKKNRLFKEVEDYAFKKNIDLIFTSNKKIDKLSKKNHQGAAALITPIEYFKFETLLEKNFKKEKQIYLLLDGITDVRNFGAIFRNSLATGVNGIIVPENSSASINSDTIKASAGAIFYIPISKVNHLNDSIYELKSRGFEIVGLEETSSKNIFDERFNKKTVLILGSEGKGINKSTLKVVDRKVSIPMEGNIKSLNVSVACGISLYHITTNNS
ncbi:MAG: 23S rRNA (guanosine(2251)-2'-O)-methyltransferase RlmB [Flavobacteriaceae bacterium]|nr:23S rRNA (guanosine(2251)-2'-O)-methyltransferase RlmB [Flavobacteriaceae bacterium]|tara:strand:+ start:1122 stop:1850 length:729 start_codon:yes stop_codon:yes gene_type:complete